MNRSVILFGASDSRHLYNYISIILKDTAKFDDITIFNVAHISDTPREFADYYKERGITINNPQFTFRNIKGPLKSICNFTERTIALSRLLRKNKYDYAIIHYCSWQAMRWVSLFCQHFSHIIPVFWGGDVLRNKKVNASYYRKVYSASDCIVLPNANSLKVFNKKTCNSFEDKSILIQFPQKMVSAFLAAEETMPSNKDVKEEYGFPQDKLIVICGHTATRAERYEQIIDELKNLPNNIINQCYFVFMMTYAPEEYRTYQTEVEHLINSYNIPGCVLKEYLNYDQMQKLHSVSDIHITNIKTDALSCFLQEQMLAGSVLVYGKWLNYLDIETPDFYAIPFEEIGQLANTLVDVVHEFESKKTKSMINRKGIINLASEEVITSEWNKILV